MVCCLTCVAVGRWGSDATSGQAASPTCGGISGAQEVEAFLPFFRRRRLLDKLSSLSSLRSLGMEVREQFEKSQRHRGEHVSVRLSRPARCHSLCSAPPATPPARFFFFHSPTWCVTSVLENRVCLSEGGCHTIMTRGCAEMKSSFSKHARLSLNSLGRSCNESFLFFLYFYCSRLSQ